MIFLEDKIKDDTGSISVETERVMSVSYQEGVAWLRGGHPELFKQAEKTWEEKLRSSPMARVFAEEIVHCTADHLESNAERLKLLVSALALAESATERSYQIIPYISMLTASEVNYFMTHGTPETKELLSMLVFVAQFEEGDQIVTPIGSNPPLRTARGQIRGFETKPDLDIQRVIVVGRVVSYGSKVQVLSKMENILRVSPNTNNVYYQAVELEKDQ